jgi:hypothetical protein
MLPKEQEEQEDEDDDDQARCRLVAAAWFGIVINGWGTSFNPPCLAVRNTDKRSVR